MLQGAITVQSASTIMAVLGGSSCMVKNDRKGRKMTSFKRQQIIIVLLDISEPLRTSMGK